jgi:formylglycine-generating enzyme required for sulfatase activity
VGSFRPNAFELYDTAGNATEWVEDCWNLSYPRRAQRRIGLDERRLLRFAFSGKVRSRTRRFPCAPRRVFATTRTFDTTQTAFGWRENLD